MATHSLSLLANLIQLTAKPMEKKVFFQSALQLVSHFADANASSIFELNVDQQTLAMKVATGPVADRLSDFLIPAHSGIIGKVVQEKKPFCSNQVEEIKEHLKSVSTTLNYAFNSVMAFPLFLQGQLFGVLQLLDSRKKNFSQDDFEGALVFCQCFSVCCEIQIALNQKKSG